MASDQRAASASAIEGVSESEDDYTAGILELNEAIAPNHLLAIDVSAGPDSLVHISFRASAPVAWWLRRNSDGAEVQDGVGLYADVRETSDLPDAYTFALSNEGAVTSEVRVFLHSDVRFDRIQRIRMAVRP